MALAGIGRAVVELFAREGRAVAVCGRDEAVEMTEEEWDRFFGIDLKSAWLGAKQVLPHAKAAGGGSIVTPRRCTGWRPWRGSSPTRRRSGLVGLTRSLVLDFGPDAIG